MNQQAHKKNVAERERSSADFCHLNKTYANLADEALQCISILDTSLNFVFSSTSFQTLLGYKSDELANMSFSDILEPCELTSALLQKAPWEGKSTIKAKGGKKRLINSAFHWITANIGPKGERTFCVALHLEAGDAKLGGGDSTLLQKMADDQAMMEKMLRSAAASALVVQAGKKRRLSEDNSASDSGRTSSVGASGADPGFSPVRVIGTGARTLEGIGWPPEYLLGGDLFSLLIGAGTPVHSRRACRRLLVPTVSRLDKFNSTVDGDSSGTTVQCQSLILYRQQREAFWCTLAAIPLRLPKKRRQNSSARTGGTDGPDPPPTKKSKKKAGGAKELMTVLLPINVSSETKIVGSYALGRILGKGAFSKVRLGRHLESDKLVAVKIIKTRTRQEAAVLKAASGAEKTELVQVHPGKDGDHEARILQCMSHKNIITLIEVLRTTRKMFIVMEYAGGGEFFKQIVNRDGGLCEIDVRRWFSQLISAVRYMHKSGVVHRDLKPENIVLDSQRKLIKIIDFGLASTFDPTNPQRHFTACGTRRFQAPEVGSEEGYLGAPVDVYSLGVILCEAVFGHELDLGDDPKTTASLIAQHLDKPSTQISRICKDLIKGMTRLEPKSRLTVEDVWKHPWLATSTGNVPTHAQQQARLRSTRRSRDVSEGNTPAPRPSSAASRRTSHTSHASHASGPQRRPPSWQDQKKNHSTIGSVTNSSGPSSRRTSDSSRLSNSSSRCSSVAGTATAAGACLEDEEVQKVLSKSKQGDECQLEWRFNGDTPVEAVSPGSYSSSSTSALSPANQRRRTIRAPVMIPSATASTAMTSPTGLRVADMNLTTSSPDAKRVESTSVETSGSGCSGTTSFAISVTEPANKLSGRIRSSSPDGKEGASHSNDNHFQELSLCADRPVIELGGPQPQQSPRELRLVVPESCSEPRVGSPLQHDLQAPFPTRPISQPPTQQSAVSLSDSETEKQIRNYLRNGTNLYPDSGHAMIRSPGRGGNGSAGTGGVGRSPLCGDADPEDGPQLQSVPAAPALRRHSEPILSPISAIPVTDRERDSDPVSGRQPITKRLEKRSIVASLRRLPASSAGTSTTTHTHVLTQSHTHSTWLPKGHPATDPLLRQARPPPAPAPSPSPAANGATQSKVGKKKINAFPTRPILRKKRIASPSPSTSRIESPSVETRPVGISSINSSANSRASSSELRLPKTHEPNSFNPGGGFERGTSSSSCSGALGTSLDLDANSVKPARPETQPRRNSNVTSLPAFSAPKSTVIPLRSMSHVGRRDTARRGVAKL